MSKFPTKRQIINALKNTNGNLSDADAKDLIKAFLVELPVCETPDSAAYCYEKLEAMR